MALPDLLSPPSGTCSEHAWWKKVDVQRPNMASPHTWHQGCLLGGATGKAAPPTATSLSRQLPSCRLLLKKTHFKA